MTCSRLSELTIPCNIEMGFRREASRLEQDGTQRNNDVGPGSVTMDTSALIEACLASDGVLSGKSSKALRFVLSFIDVLEAIVLSERIHCVRHGPDPHREQGGFERYGPLGVLLEKTEILSTQYAGDRERHIKARFAEQKFYSDISFDGLSIPEDIPLVWNDRYELLNPASDVLEYCANSIDISHKTNVRYIPSRKNFGTYVAVYRHNARQRLSLQDELLGVMTRGMQQEYKSVSRYLEFGDIFLPPIAVSILSEADNLVQALLLSLEYRQKFEGVRTRLQDYEQVLTDPTSPLSERLDARLAFEAICKEVSKPYSVLDRLQLSEWVSIADLFSEALQDDPSLISAAKKTAKLPFDYLMNKFKMRNLHMLNGVRRENFKAPSHQVLLEKHFAPLGGDLRFTDEALGLVSAIELLSENLSEPAR